MRMLTQDVYKRQTASIEYDESEIGVISAYLVTSEADLTVFDTALLTYDEEKGQYYYRFADNGSYTFRFSDAAGNTGLATATVAKFDTLAPEISSITWTANGKTYTDPEEIPKLALTNKAVTATVAFTKAILPEVSSEGFLPEYTCLLYTSRCV